jgi:hypothetical protein
MSAIVAPATQSGDAGVAPAVAFAFDGPPVMTAGSLDRWTLCFAALAALAPGARIGVAHRWPSDWGIAQSSDPSAVDYLEVTTSSGACARWWNARLHTWHPFDHIVFVELPQGLEPGATLAMRYGEGRHGSPGFRVQTYAEEGSPFSLRCQPRDDAPWSELARHAIPVIGAKPARLVLTLPSRVAARASFDAHVRIEDQWGNPASLEAPLDVDLTFAHQREPLDIEQNGAQVRAPRDVERTDTQEPATPPTVATVPPRAWTRIPLALDRPGIHRLVARVRSNPALQAEGNPVEVDADPRYAPLFWGDLHAQSVIGCGARSIDAYYAHARDFSANDVSSHQANCFLVSTAEWHETAASTERHHAPGRFVTLLGVEWSGASSLGGDHNLYFPGDAAELHRCSHEFVADRSDVATDLPHIEDVYRHYRGSDTLVAVHVGGRTADLAWHEPGLDRLLEVHSTHATSEWFLFDALRRGYRMGVIAGSDGVDGRPGNSHPGHLSVRNVRGGLTAIAASGLTRAAIWQALEARHCYATTGERILLRFSAGGAQMGDAIDAGPGFARAGFDVHVEGTAPLERIDFFRDAEMLHSVDCFADAGALSNRVRVAWHGLSAPGNWQRARMSWEGGLRVEGARILAVEGWAFDTPDEGVREHDATRVQWRSVTAGDWDGVEIELDHVDDAQLWFATAAMTLRTVLSSRNPAQRFEARNPERCVEFRQLPRTMPSRSFGRTFTDPAPVAGQHAYWVRVRQSDGHFAWSSPIFLNVSPG